MDDQVSAASVAEHRAGFEIGRSSALERLAVRAREFDVSPRFPVANFADLRAAGLLAQPPGGYAEETELVRAVAAADASTARILDGHLNGLERLAVACPEAMASDLGAGMLLGVWGADPAAGEGCPAVLKEVGDEWVVDGVKTFCSGAGGVDRALVVVGTRDGTRRLVCIDATEPRVEIDRDWYRASGLRASESHRVVFHEVPVLAFLGGPDELSREPYFSRDAIRTSATWVGLVDTILDEVVALHRDRPVGELAGYRLGQLRVTAATIDLWFEHAVRTLAGVHDCTDGHPGSPAANSQAQTVAIQCRVALSGFARMVLDLSAELAGSHALIGESRLDRARRDLDLFLLQHRLDRKLSALGAALVDGGRR